MVRSGVALNRLYLTSLIEQNPHPGTHELTFVHPEVVGAQEQLQVPAIRNEDAQQQVGLCATPIAAICRRENHGCHLMPPMWERTRQRLMDRL
jgi:hypothetical protein